MKKLKVLLYSLAFISVFWGAAQIQESYAIPICGEHVCLQKQHYCDLTPCWLSTPQGMKAGNCEIWCEGNGIRYW